MDSSNRLRMLVEAGLAIAIAYVLHFIVLFQMPQGGAVKAANLVPLIIFSLRWGGKAGLLTGIAYGLIHFLLGFKFTLHIASFFLDYLIAYGVMGVAGFFHNTRGGAVMGTITACVLRWVSSVISGAVVFASYAPKGMNPWLYSMGYNATYMIPDMAINVIVIVLFYKQLMKGIKAAQR